MDEKELLEIIERAAEDKQTVLDLSAKGITSLPLEIGQLTNLTALDLSDNQLTNLPVELGQLTNLTALYLSRNQLTSVPVELGQLTNLTELHLSHNQLTSVPVELGQLTNLMELYLTNNQLTRIPGELGQLTALTFLYLDYNQLTSVPAELGKLTELRWLFLNNNQLASLAKDVGKMRSLIGLKLSINEVRSIPPDLGNLMNLSELDLGGNQLTSVPTELGQLTNLEHLDLGFNELVSVPVELSKLTKLTFFDLSKNQLKTIPEDFSKLKRLREFYIDGNEGLTSPPPEVVKQGTRAILSYLRELAKGAKKRYEAKLLILGDGGEGKTCVSRALRGLDFEPQVRTPGVEVVPWTFANPRFRSDKEKEITLNIWDFEGQEINHQSHQFFLTDKSLYLLVMNGRREFRMDRPEYWLDTIRARAPQSRVILVASECEDTTPSWPLDKLKQEYGDILQGDKWYFAVGCQTGKRIDELSEEIRKAAADMKQMGKEWPATYQRAEEIIVQRRVKEASVSKAGLCEIFTNSDIDDEGFKEASEDMARLGLITKFDDCPSLEDFVVLNPQWLTKGISLVMEDETLKDNKGEITHERMKQIWDDGYGGLYPILHSCMKEFELLYDMEDKPGCLVPLRFGDVRPDIPWSDISGAKERRIEYKINIHPPKGIMSRFIVKTHHMIAKTDSAPKGVYWDKGVFLRTGDGEYRSEALCEFIEADRTLRITVRAAFPQNMVEQLHGFAKAVFGFFDGLKPERSYGCVKFEEKEQQCEGAHPERRILFALSRDKDIDCDRGWHVVNPKDLVFGFSTFGEAALTLKELKEQLDKKPRWAEGLAGDVMSSLVWIDKIYKEVILSRQEHKELSARNRQEIELKLRDHIRLMNEMLDNRDFNAAPALISIAPVDGSTFNPKNWFEKEYELVPYCEYEFGVHRADFHIKFRKPKVWWIKTAPTLSLAVRAISVGVQIACAGLPLAVKPEIFEGVEKHVDFMKELAGHLELEGGAASDISIEAGRVVEKREGNGIIRDFRQLRDRDEKRILRMQLAQLLEEIAPINYKARHWGELQRVRMPDNTYRWLCEKHAAEYRK